jgi:molybdate transport system substrate-binding protein
MKLSILSIIFSLGIGIAFLSYYFWLKEPEPVTIIKTRVAVAANFFKPLTKLTQLFESKHTLYKVTLVSAASGTLYTQIKHGLPFDVFLSADTQRPHLLIQEGYAVPESLFVYVKGRLILWSKNPDLVDAQGEVLKTEQFTRLAVAPIKKAPYGAAAKQTLQNLGLWDKLWFRILQSTNLTHLYQLVDSGEAELGFLALSQLADKENIGSRWIVPKNICDPLEQSAVLLKKGQDNAAAKALLAFLQSAAAHPIIEEFGYEIP